MAKVMKSGAKKAALDELSIADRLRVAAEFLSAEHPGKVLTVAEVCRSAGVNRSNVYNHHVAVLDEIIPKRGLSSAERGAGAPSLRQRLQNAIAEAGKVDAMYKALLVVCLEQQAEIRSLRIRCTETPPRTTSRRK